MSLRDETAVASEATALMMIGVCGFLATERLKGDAAIKIEPDAACVSFNEKFTKSIACLADRACRFVEAVGIPLAERTVGKLED